jgi:molybdenum cofactor synthesis domain-containing protein
MRVAILTVSDKGSRGQRADTSGDAIRELVTAAGGEIVGSAVVPDEAVQISAQLRAWCDEHAADIVLTTGGTGLAARDITPEATAAVAERFVPGIPEAMRATGLMHTPRAMLSRSVAVVRGRTLIVNLPGSEKGVRESLSAIIGVLAHASELLGGQTEHNA